MKNIRKYTAALLIAAGSLGAFAKTEENVETRYRRSSLCSFLVSRTDQKMFDKIQSEYLNMPTPDQYNNHDLSIRVLNVGKKAEYADSLDSWLAENFIASRLVGRWFSRNVLTGECSLDLVKSRGLYNASDLDIELAKRTPRGMAMLADAGEDLIGNTFVLVHEAHYIDNAQRGKNVGTGLRIAGAFAGAFLGSGVSDLFDSAADMAETFKGFRVKFHTRLYRLEWTPEDQGTFYQEYWTDKPNEDKRLAFENNRGKFRLRYIGEVESSGSQNSFLGISEEHPEIMIRKACKRAIDDNVRDLQKAYDEFRVKSPVKAVDGKDVLVAIGLKEGLTEDSEYEVLEPEEKDGKMVYKRVGVIQPVKDKIWDNRYMAAEEGAYGADFGATTFKVKSGSMPYEGLLVRQLK